MDLCLHVGESPMGKGGDASGRGTLGHHLYLAHEILNIKEDSPISNLTAWYRPLKICSASSL